jgi:CBS domain-containing protein
MRVSDIMTYGVEFLVSSDPVKKAAERMRDKNIGVIPIFEGGEPVGMLTDRDIALRVVAEGRDPSTVRVSDVMTPGVVFCYEDQDIEDAVDIMEQRKIRRLLVKNFKDEVVGVLSTGDIAMSSTKELVGELIKEVSGVAYPER